jgi:hypothetical protein
MLSNAHLALIAQPSLASSQQFQSNSLASLPQTSEKLRTETGFNTSHSGRLL